MSDLQPLPWEHERITLTTASEKTFTLKLVGRSVQRLSSSLGQDLAWHFPTTFKPGKCIIYGGLTCFNWISISFFHRKITTFLFLILIFKDAASSTFIWLLWSISTLLSDNLHLFCASCLKYGIKSQVNYSRMPLVSPFFLKGQSSIFHWYRIAFRRFFVLTYVTPPE